jgi:hypothetical protein
MMSMTLGSLIGAAVLTSGVNETYFYVVLASMALVASISFIFIRKPLPHKVEPVEVHTTLMTSTSELEVQSPNSQNKIQRSTVMESTQSLIPNE